jgi:hypothetical protein
MNLDFGKVLKDGDVTAGAAISTTETLPGIFGTVPNFTAAVIFFIALWNSWCVTERAQHSCYRHSHTCLAQVHVRELHGSFPVLRRCHHPAFFHVFPRGPRDGHRHRPVGLPAKLPLHLTLPSRFWLRRGGSRPLQQPVRFYSRAPVCHERHRRLLRAPRAALLHRVLLNMRVLLPHHRHRHHSENISHHRHLPLHRRHFGGNHFDSLFRICVCATRASASHERAARRCVAVGFRLPSLPVLMSPSGLILVSVGESIIQLALRKAELDADILTTFMLGYAMLLPS